VRSIRVLPFLLALLALGAGLPEKEGLVPRAYAQPKEPAKIPEKDGALPEDGLGTREIPRPDGGRDRVFYSVTTPEEERKNREEEKEKNERSWEMLRNIILDRRSR